MLVFDQQLPSEDYEERALELVGKIIPSWDLQRVIFKKFTDGLTNTLFGCRLDDSESQMLLFRVYGEGTERFIDRQSEKLSMLCLQTAGLAAPLRAVFSNGLVYDYVPGRILDRSLAPLSHIFPLVASAMARFHRVAPPVAPLSPASSGDSGSDRVACVWSLIDRCLGLVPDHFGNSSSSGQPRRGVRELRCVAQLQAELLWLRQLLQPLHSPLVFSHNDALLSNIVLLPATATPATTTPATAGGDGGGSGDYGSAMLIDFEYSGLNYQAFDIGNHFNEFAGTDDYDYSHYPSADYQKQWLRCYLRTYLAQDGDSPEHVHVQERDVEILYAQVNKFALLSHFLWGVWAMVQARFSKIDYDFINMAIQRFNEYDRRKEEFSALQPPSPWQYHQLSRRTI